MQQCAIARRSPPYRDPELEQFIGQILTVLMPAEAAHGIMPRVVLASDVTLNAYSFPDGAIYIHTGLLSRLENEAEMGLLLAMNWSTSLASMPCRCNGKSGGSRCGIRRTECAGFLILVSGHFGGLRPYRAIGWSIEPAAQAEQEADRLGLDMVIKANYDPCEALEIFEHLREDKKGHRRGAGRCPFSDVAAVHSHGVPSDGPKRLRKHLQQLLFEQARIELRHGRWDEALRCVYRLLRDAPTHACGHFLLGEILRQRTKREMFRKRSLIIFGPSPLTHPLRSPIRRSASSISKRVRRVWHGVSSKGL